MNVARKEENENFVHQTKQKISFHGYIGCCNSQSNHEN
jgi:hypothetical protein